MYRITSTGLLALLLFSGGAHAQLAAPPLSQTGDDVNKCALPAVAVSVDLNQLPNSDLVTVPVEINGKPKTFLLSVGTAASAVSQAAVRDLRLIEGIKRTETFQNGSATQSEAEPNRDANVGGMISVTMVDVRNGQRSDERPRVNIPAFTIGGATGRNLPFAIARENEISKAAPYDGILTGDFFKQYDVELDFSAMKLRYLTANTCSDPHQVVFWPHKEVAIIPINMVNGKIEVQVDIGAHKINAILDTGSARTIMRRDIAENSLNLKADSPQMPAVSGMKDGEDMQIFTATFPQIVFAGGVTAYNVPALIQVNGMTHNLHKEASLGSRAQFKADPRIPALTLGMDVLRQLHLYVVYGKNEIYMTAAD
jgi:hypothetical protein